MHPKIKVRPAGKLLSTGEVMPHLVHDGLQQSPAVNPASRHHPGVPKSAAAGANHARHHVSRRTQS
jgi:hypothetical protein